MFVFARLEVAAFGTFAPCWFGLQLVGEQSNVHRLRHHSSYQGVERNPDSPTSMLPIPGVHCPILVLLLGGPLALRARVACYRAAESGRATEPADAVSAHSDDMG